MGYKIEWKEILMIIGSGAGGILSALLFAITGNDLSFTLFPLFTVGGWVLGFIIEKII